MSKVRTFAQLSQGERNQIEVLLHQGFSYCRIAQALNRSVSTISREVKRNGPRNYSAEKAQRKTYSRHRFKAKHRVFDQRMRDYISEKLVLYKWSPELISVMGRKQCCKLFVSHEWIYEWIWKMKFSQNENHRCYSHLYEHLRHAHRRRKRSTKRHNRGNILERVWIDQRPAAADCRSRTGDLEADIMLGKDRKPGLLVALDRRSRKAWIRKLKVKDSDYVMRKLEGIVRQCGQVKTLTFDNDQSFARHYKLHGLGIQTFFTHPYSSQEKGSVENRIGLIRIFFGKQTDFSTVSEDCVRKVEKIINERPLRMFGYKTPNDLFKKTEPLH
jgi:IS30 family transposase